MIDWTEIVISICTLVITGILAPMILTAWKKKKSELSKAEIETVEYWTDVAVRWAKQWLQSETGEKKKEEVLSFLCTKLSELKINIAEEDIDKMIEAVYEKVKSQKEIVNSCN